jgi:hypothetical protein
VRLGRLIIEVASCFYQSFCQACVAGGVPVKPHGN